MADDRVASNGIGPVVVLLSRDLRVHDHPALAEAARAKEPVAPLFVIDRRLIAAPKSANRAAFLIESLTDLRVSLQRLGGQLYVRIGDPVDEAMRMVAELGARSLFVSEDASALARRRQDRLARACQTTRVRFAVFPGTNVVGPGDLLPAGGDHYRVFTPYWRRWRAVPWRAVEVPPSRLQSPAHLRLGRMPSVRSLTDRPVSPRRPAGGETVGRRIAAQWLHRRLGEYTDGHDDLSGDRTSRLSPYLHFGCVSPVDLAVRAIGRPGGDDFVRQLCWRDFHHQVLAAFPGLGQQDYRPRPERRWRSDAAAVEAWQHGETGAPIVDAGMRQLAAEGWMHNRARLVVAAYLTRQVGVHWRVGAEHFMDWLVDADVANNYGNWQWVAGTGNDTRPNRRFNLARQAERFDPHGDYVRRHVPELAEIGGVAVHRA